MGVLLQTVSGRNRGITSTKFYLSDYNIVMMSEKERKSGMEEPCVRVFIHGESEPVVEYDPDCNTVAVKEELLRAFGPGILKRKINGRGVITEILSCGDYEYHLLVQQGK
jgi:hypothetical protein